MIKQRRYYTNNNHITWKTPVWTLNNGIEGHEILLEADMNI